MIYYLLAILGNIKITIGIIATISLILSILLAIVYAANLSDKEEISDDFKRMCKISHTTVFISWILLTLIPSQKQAAFIVLAPAIVENKDIQDSLKNIPEIAKLGTDYIKEILKMNNDEEVTSR